MHSRCPICQEPLLATARFCIGCGAALRQSAAPPVPARASATGPTIRLAMPVGAQSRPPGRPACPGWSRNLLAQVCWAARGVFTWVFILGLTVGLTRSLTLASSHPLGFWPVGIVGIGALCAVCAWVRGALWLGLSGMLTCAGLMWLLTMGYA